MSATAVTCAHCGDIYNSESPQLWRRVIGWERKGSGESRKGGSDIALRERCDEYACDFCIGRLKRGLSAQQGSLL